MNAIHSHCIGRRVLAAAALLCFALAAAAQTRPFDKVVRDNLWLGGSNAAGLRENRSADISYVELYGGYEEGGLHREWESPSPWRAGAAAKTVKHLDRFSMKGGFSFEQMSGPDMRGQMSLRPGYYPLDVLEFTPGKKTRQTYAFDGSISIDLSGGWRLGASMDFTSANYAKRKDLRHTNYLLDMMVTPGISYTVPSGDLSLGVNYIFRKNSESIVPEQVGTGGTGAFSYYAFLDKGLMYGKYEVWTGSGVHLDEAGVQGFPQQEQFHGIGLQMGSGSNYYADIEYLYGFGKAGEKQTVWYRFPSHNVNVRASSVFDLQGGKLYLRGTYEWRYQTNSETVLDKVVSGGVTTTEEYGSNRILARETSRSRLEAEMVRPGFEYVVSLEYSTHRTTASHMYPFVAKADHSTYVLSVAPSWYKGNWDFGGSLCFLGGSVTEDSLSLAADDSGVLTEPFRLREWYDRGMDYIVAPKMEASVFLRRNFSHGIYLEVDGAFRQAFGGTFPDGSSRLSGLLRLGWTF